MTIIGSDPFSTLVYQQAQIATPLVEGGAGGADDLDTAQRSITIGEVVPIVFGRRVGAVGGVLISPGATEARFENSLTNEVTATYHLTLSQGQLQAVQVRDVFQRSCRVGTFTQSYNRRGGTWTAGNFIIDRGGSYVKPEAPYYCGSGGTYEAMTTGSFAITAPDGDTRWDRQVHLFIRGGMYVTRLLDDVLGPSNNVADLALWLLRNTSRTPEALIDVDAFEAAASFTDQLGLWFNGAITESSNYEDWLADHARYFLLSKGKRGGKVGLRPLLPTTSTNALQVTPVQPVYVFDESRIIPGSFEISYVPLNERKPFCALMLWRQQPEDDIGLIRTTEVRYAGAAADGPYEQHDLSEFATSENHAVKVGAYIVARRRYVTHTLRVKTRPASFNPTLSQGDIVQVVMQRVASAAAAGEHRYLYEVDRISKSRDGEVALDLTHFPVDSLGRSLVALDVAAATGGGVLLSTAKSGVSCDVNADDDETEATDDGQDPTGLPSDDAFDVILDDTDFGTGADGDGVVGGDGYGGGGGDGDPNPVEPLDGTPQIEVPLAGAVCGETLTAPDVCPGAGYRWLRLPPGEDFGDLGPIADEYVVSGATGSGYSLGLVDAGQDLVAQIFCPGGATTTTGPVRVDPCEDNRGGVDRTFTINYTLDTYNSGGPNCVVSTGIGSGSSSQNLSATAFGVGFRVTNGSGVVRTVCGTGTTIVSYATWIEVVRADGSAANVLVAEGSYISYSNGDLVFQNTRKISLSAVSSPDL